ncbi:hypothetical protein SARC_10328 [Sphaeroforma arctica JP610]|uniref:Uncharacterized protein n=1 Tax=Sphaeroforma arctica JP610 TaxID=667725 RepID=A0A0L0FKB0_9EUKA|nr:hypothetical protein SARC_10328 [Sphaeroforma arctica JP610]KNC77209.1 hypothetical protein SARC_10328 [Sphaeroforma arctica JP610]|eukprot:XP_014151111.1 hypothetical protein SARC_10328 [Sphaeroforma arctica JP610]
MTSIEGASATHDGGDSEPDMDVPHGTVSAAINKKAEVDADSLAEAQKLIEDWCNDKEKTARQFRQFKLMKVLGKRPRRGVGGKVIITSLLPNRLANAAYCCMQSIKERDWELSNEDSDVKNSVLKTDKDAKGGNPTHTQTQHVSNTYGAGSTAHRFNAAALSSEKALDLLQKTIAEGIYPECKLFSFQLGRYQSDDLIEEHDDAAYEDLEVIDKKTNTTGCCPEKNIVYLVDPL